MLLAAGLQDSSDGGVPDSGVLHDQGQEELPAPQPACHGLCLPLQAGQRPALLSVGTHAFFDVQRAAYCGPCWAIKTTKKLTLCRDCNESPLRRQPRALTMGYSPKGC